MVPSRIVTHVFLDQLFRRLKLTLIPEVEPADQPLTVGPDVVVLGIELEHLGDEVGLALGRVQSVDNQLAVVPDLVILLVCQCRLVEPVEFLAKICVERFKDFGAV